MPTHSAPFFVQEWRTVNNEKHGIATRFDQRNPMDTKQILSALDDEIEKLTYVRTLLTNTGFDGKRPASKRSTMSAQGRKNIADAQRKRWAKAKAKNRQPNKPPIGG